MSLKFNKPIVTMDRFRRRFWKLYPMHLLELGDSYWAKSDCKSTNDFNSNAFFTEERLKNLSEHFNTLEDAVKLGVNMFYHRDVLLDLERRYYTNISQMVLTLFANFIITRHNGDKRTVYQLVEIFFNIAKTQCAEIIQLEFEDWSQNDIGDYRNLDLIEGDWKETFTEKEKKIFGWEDKKTPERYFDYLGSCRSLKEYGKSKVPLNDSMLDSVIDSILTNAPLKFAFQYLPSAQIYRSQYDYTLDLGLVANDISKRVWTEKLLWKIAETDLEKKHFEANLRDIFSLNEIEDDLEKFLDAYPRSLFMKVFRSLVYFSEKKGINELFKELKTKTEFRPRIQKFKADCEQSYIIEYMRGNNARM